ncbi:MAG TPA: 2-oxoglutarate dehydrogenase, E2 component, dihydrolipoamide succinyltransferase [Bryobacteraceae bacterium]|jgi:2-oxoglutarate dehydrogenase E2 component (dihydrolipoamide succinyltransferase)|nr:2-oxoglutarate dehydrogenase, E2 component, dihydrolipoamide succinyltransferase [Bryobacteraceae bacterium]
MIDVVMPQMGESIVEGTLTKWLKKPGERVERDEPLFEISTDKVDTEIPAPAAGILKEVLVEEGKTVGINTVVGRIDESGDGQGSDVAPSARSAAGGATASPAEQAPEPRRAAAESITPTPVPPPASSREDINAPQPAAAAAAPSVPAEEPPGPLSPLVRKMAREFNIDLRQIRGTGAGGRITKQDLENYMSQQAARTVASVTAPAYGEPARAAQAPAMPPAPPAEQELPPLPRAEAPRARIEPMSTMRQKIAEHMVFSKRTSAHVTTVHKVDMTKVARMRERYKADFQRRYGFSLTYLPFVTRAASAALRQFPIVNASIEGTNIIYHNDINIGIAVALENGLIVPVIRNADEKNIVGLQRAIVDLSTRARSRQLKPDEVQGGTFSITNFGSFGSVFATPIINQPQVAILGVGSVEKTPVVVEDAIAIRSVCYLALTFDHRLIDGALADQFTGAVKHILENWSEEIL